MRLFDNGFYPPVEWAEHELIARDLCHFYRVATHCRLEGNHQDGWDREHYIGHWCAFCVRKHYETVR